MALELAHADSSIDRHHEDASIEVAHQDTAAHLYERACVSERGATNNERRNRELLSDASVLIEH